LHAHCYWALRNEGKTFQQATDSLHKLSVARKNELLWERGINFNDLPLWQKRGVGLYWETYQKAARNPLTGEDVIASRRRLKTELELPMKDDYGFFVRKLIEDSSRIDSQTQ
jgi:tRNA(His) 5'-end guanylyltransferase